MSPVVRLGRVARCLCVAFVIVSAAGVLSGCDKSQPKGSVPLVALNSSWVPGEGSLLDLPAFRAIEQRAEVLAADRLHARQILLDQILAAKQAAKKRELERALQRFLAARRRALALYRAALRRNAIATLEAKAKQKAAQEEYARAKAEYERLLRVAPGTECSLPEVRRYFQCHGGRLPG